METGLENRSIQIERNPNGKGVIKHILIDGKKVMSTSFPSLGAAIQDSEKRAASQYLHLSWRATDEFTATGKYC